MSQMLKKLFFVFAALLAVGYLWTIVPKPISKASTFGTINSSDGHFTLTPVNESVNTNSYYVGFNITKNNGGSFQWQVIQHFCADASDYCGNYGGDQQRSTGWQTANTSVSNAGNSLGVDSPSIAYPGQGYANCGSYQIDVWLSGYSIPMNAGWYNTGIKCSAPTPTITPTQVPPTITPTHIPPTATPTPTKTQQPTVTPTRVPSMVPTVTPTPTTTVITNQNCGGDNSTTNQSGTNNQYSDNCNNNNNNNSNVNNNSSSSNSSSNSSSSSSSSSNSSVDNSGNSNNTINVNNTNNNTVNVPPAQIVYGSYAGNGTVQVQPASQATSLPKTGPEGLLYLVSMVPTGLLLKKFSKVG